MHNIVSIIGNLGADPDIKYSANGTAIANLRIAVNDYRKDQNGNSQQQTYWFSAVAFGKTAEIVGQFTSKGHKIGIIGKLVQREWEDQGGNKRSSVEIRIDSVELLSGTGNGASQGQGQNNGYQNGQQGQRQQGGQQNRGAPPPPPPQGQGGYQPQGGGYQSQGGYTKGQYNDTVPPPEDDIPF